jgi:hypothetical protein
VYENRVWAFTESRLALECVQGRHSSDVFAAGWRSLAHFDGGTWTLTDHTMGGLYELWAAPGGELFAATSTGLWVENGAGWIRAPGCLVNGIVDIWGTSNRDMFLVSADGRHVFHYDGNTCQPILEQTSRPLTVVWGASSRNVFVGGDRGLLYRYAVPDE